MARFASIVEYCSFSCCNMLCLKGRPTVWTHKWQPRHVPMSKPWQIDLPVPQRSLLERPFFNHMHMSRHPVPFMVLPCCVVTVNNRELLRTPEHSMLMCLCPQANGAGGQLQTNKCCSQLQPPPQNHVASISHNADHDLQTSMAAKSVSIFSKSASKP